MSESLQHEMEPVFDYRLPVTVPLAEQVALRYLAPLLVEAEAFARTHNLSLVTGLLEQALDEVDAALTAGEASVSDLLLGDEAAP